MNLNSFLSRLQKKLYRRDRKEVEIGSIKTLDGNILIFIKTKENYEEKIKEVVRYHLIPINYSERDQRFTYILSKDNGYVWDKRDFSILSELIFLSEEFKKDFHLPTIPNLKDNYREEFKKRFYFSLEEGLEIESRLKNRYQVKPILNEEIRNEIFEIIKGNMDSSYFSSF
ncbi:MAG: hypothetical protein B6U78_01575 [Candidatus Aenigmarchaeota archaeon ex4484_224]|nr:MAG: hypothetical protein B6U78_01575 [Candidatus Aenigmarchaeota archaeon ex4484_224]